MAKGQSKGNRRDRGNRIIKGEMRSVNVLGNMVDLSDSPLAYGEKDPSLVGAARATIEEFENTYYNNDIEHSILTDSYGNVIETNVGTHENVSSSEKARNMATTLSHNHPSEPGVIGGTFSFDDMDNFIGYNQKNYRATCEEGTYSITKTHNFNGKKLLSQYKKCLKQTFATAGVENEALAQRFKRNEISMQEYTVGLARINNKMLVSNHNWLLSNQVRYGYKYTLERRQSHG